MLKCNLAVLLAERSLKISKVAQDTKISRTTLTSLVNNHSQGIQLETLNTICTYLRIAPKDFFCFVPYDLSCNIGNVNKDSTGYNFDMEIQINTSTSTRYVYLTGYAYKNEGSISVTFYDVEPTVDEEVNGNIDNVLRFIKPLPTIFRKALQDDITEEITSHFDREPRLATVEWPDNLFE